MLMYNILVPPEREPAWSPPCLVHFLPSFLHTKSSFVNFAPFAVIQLQRFQKHAVLDASTMLASSQAPANLASDNDVHPQEAEMRHPRIVLFLKELPNFFLDY